MRGGATTCHPPLLLITGTTDAMGGSCGNCITDCCVGEDVVVKDDAVRGAGRPLAATVESANQVAPDVKASDGVTKLSPKPSVTELPDVPDRPVGRASCVWKPEMVPVP